MRGSGVTGLAGMGAVRRFSKGFLVRPLLGVAGDDLRAYAAQHGLRWIDDPSNDDVALDRNYLRREILPRLAARWPAVATRLRQSADLAAESSELLSSLADLDLAASPSSDRLDIRTLGILSGPRLRNALRRAVILCGLPPVPASRLYQVEHELIPAREDAQPRVTWTGGEMRRFRDHLYILPAELHSSPLCGGILRPGGSLDLGIGNGSLLLESCNAGGIAESVAAKGIDVRYRRGGEAIRLPNHARHRKLKKLFQEEGIVPWMRERMPLLYAGDRLVAVANLWIDAEFHAEQGYVPRWINGPALY
jgi:tRNA(Ile)-lysidine synthase